MTSSTSSSSRVRRLLAMAAAVCVAGCAGARPAAESVVGPAPVPRRVLVLPPENLVNGPLPVRELTARLEQVVAMAGAEVVGGQRLDEYLARYRIRYTGGVDAVAARAARDDLGADAMLVTSVMLWGETPPRAALVSRLVSASESPAVLWMDGYARAGDDAPALFGLGIVSDPELLRAQALNAVGESLAAFLAKGVQADRCSGGGWWRPRLAYRARPDDRKVTTVAVLPFVNETRRRGAGEAVALELASQLASTGGFRIVELGVVREELLRRRIVMEDGVSLDQARLVSAALDADLVAAGYVFDYEDGVQDPGANFTAMVIDRKTGRMIWESVSYDRGSDSETLFGFGKVSTTPALACRMAREVADAMSGERALPRR
jgi:hypothetical protein